MEIVDKVIFNKLLAKESLSLPDIGVLVLSQTPAKLVDKNILTPPQWRVTFSKQRSDSISIIDVICMEIGVNSDQALEIYREWMKGASQGGGHVIDGVGDISKDFFTLDKSLAILINPLDGKSVKVSKKSGKSTSNLGVILLITAVVALGLGYFIFENVVKKREEVSEIKTIAWKGSEDESTVIVADTTLDNKGVEQSGVDVSDTVNIEIPNDKKVKSTTYYLSVGVYSTAENADEFIEKLKKRSNSIEPTRLLFKNNKFLVSVFSSKNYAVVEKYKGKLAARFPGAWIYKEVK